MSKPNILVFFTDQQRFDTIAALGNPVIKTPALDRIANEGVAFTSTYSPSPVCVPARCCMHYGQYPMHTGCYRNGSMMPEDACESYVAMLTKAGYRTHSIGKCHFTPDRNSLRGYQTREVQEEGGRDDDYHRYLAEQGVDVLEPHGVRSEMYYVPQVSQLPQKHHPTQWVGDRSVAFIEEQADKDVPWYLFSSYIHPHPPFAPPSPWHKLYRAYDMPLPKVPQDSEALHTKVNRSQNMHKNIAHGISQDHVRGVKAHYYACISFVDYQIGRILETLEKTGQLENTMILMTADHGELLGDYNCMGKRSMHDSASRVPMLAWMPGRFEGGVRCDLPASLVDVMPTVLAAAGVESENRDGVDLHDLLTGATDREAVFAQDTEMGEAVYFAVTDRWKYAYSVPDNEEYLFDRLKDPQETRNKFHLPTTVAVRKAMRARLIEFLKSGDETGDIVNDDWKKPRKHHTETVDPDSGYLLQDMGGVPEIPGYSE